MRQKHETRSSIARLHRDHAHRRLFSDKISHDTSGLSGIRQNIEQIPISSQQKHLSSVIVQILLNQVCCQQIQVHVSNARPVALGWQTQAGIERVSRVAPGTAPLPGQRRCQHQAKLFRKIGLVPEQVRLQADDASGSVI